MRDSSPNSVRQFVLGIARFLTLVGLYVLAGRFGRQFDYVQENARVLLPQAGVALAGLVVFGLRYWPAIPIASLVVVLSARSRQASVSMNGEELAVLLAAVKVPFRTALGLAIANTIGALAGAWMLTRFGQFSPRMARLRDVYVFLLCGLVLAPAVGATLAVAAVTWTTSGTTVSPAELWPRRWFGIGVSNLIVAPLLFTWSARYRVYPTSRSKWSEAVLLTVASVWICLIVFTSQSTLAPLNYPLSFVPFPFIIWAALRFGSRGASTITIIVAAISIYGTSQGYGPFVRRAGPEALFLLQVYLTAVAASALLLAAAVAEQTEAKEHLLESREQLRALTARLQEAREEERAAVSREIHDELGQQLTGLKMGLHSLSRKLAGDSPGLAARASELMHLSEEAVESVRRIASDLRPGVLDDLGVVAALEWLAGEFERRMEISVTFSSDVADVSLSREKRTAVFRILQESLTNVARHAHASHVEILLRRADGNLVLIVRDDGIGISTGGNGLRKSLGLTGMRERAFLVGGSVSVGRAEDAPAEAGQPGTVVVAQIPLDGGMHIQ